MKTFLKTASLIVLLALCACVDEAGDNGDGSRIKVGGAVPPFAISGPYGEIGSGDLAGRRTMMIFFASYCSDCRHTMGRIEQVWEYFEGDDNYLIAPISRQDGDETSQSVAEYWAGAGFAMPYYLDAGRELYDQFASTTVPRIYIIDRQGRVEWMAVGEPEQSAQQLIELMEQ